MTQQQDIIYGTGHGTLMMELLQRRVHQFIHFTLINQMGVEIDIM